MNTDTLKEIAGVLWLDDQPVKTEYDCYEVHPVRDIAKLEDGYDPENGTMCDVCEPEDAEFWSVYGHVIGEGLVCLADCDTQELAKEVESMLTVELNLLNGWVLTDPSCNQYRKEIVKNQIYEFKEERLTNPISGATDEYKNILDFNKCTPDQLIDACSTFGYSREEVQDWISGNHNIELMLECLFELE